MPSPARHSRPSTGSTTAWRTPCTERPTRARRLRSARSTSRGSRSGRSASLRGSSRRWWGHVLPARGEIDAGRLPYAAAHDAGVERGVAFIPLETLRERRRFPLAPPRPGEPLVFARDLGPRNPELLRALGGPPAWIL